MIIRPASREDLAAMAQLTSDARSFASSPDPHAWDVDSEAEMVERLRVYLPDEKRTAFVVEVEGRLIAFTACRLIAYKPDDQVAIIDLLAVGQAYRGRGIGTRLVRETMARLAAQGITRVNVHVASDNEPAVRFWRRLGFGTLALTMSLPIASRES
jgi:ribosomal protein S18 acetylase RimI-like enzyme